MTPRQDSRRISYLYRVPTRLKSAFVMCLRPVMPVAIDRASGVRVVTIGELLDEDLSIPPYQRPYSWEPTTALQLLDDIREAWGFHTSAADAGEVRGPSHVLGAVILHMPPWPRPSPPPSSPSASWLKSKCLSSRWSGMRSGPWSCLRSHSQAFARRRLGQR